MKRFRLLLLALAWALCAIIAKAQADSLPPLRPVTSSYMLAAGAGHLADTYLSPLHYHGPTIGLMYERSQAMKFAPRLWTMRLWASANADMTSDNSGRKDMYAVSVQAGWSMMRRWAPVKGLTLGIGPGTAIDLGALYINRSSSNNPASAKASWTVDANAFASYNCRLWRLPITLRYNARLPITGAFFAPDYGQLYYQIYIGDRKRLAHAAWWGNFFRLDNLLTADIHLGNTSLRLGYKCNVFSSKSSGIVSRDICHMAVIGITTEWISLPARSSKLPASSIISAY